MAIGWWILLIGWLIFSGLNLAILFTNLGWFGGETWWQTGLIAMAAAIGGPIIWGAIFASIFWDVLKEWRTDLFETWILPLWWPAILDRHDQAFAAAPLPHIPLELKGYFKTDTEVHGGPFGGYVSYRHVYITHWFGADPNTEPSQALVLYMLRWGHHADALMVRTDLLQLRHQMQPKALIVWCFKCEPMSLMRQAIEDLADAVIVELGEKLDLPAWCAQHRPDLLPDLRHQIEPWHSLR
ncbi:hypothetical protein HY523_01530 [Candidatus Berkelbacteria bacterium]|nr:hypothetical protein [Candidatus Berkelbacteria bacterium]